MFTFFEVYATLCHLIPALCMTVPARPVKFSINQSIFIGPVSVDTVPLRKWRHVHFRGLTPLAGIMEAVNLLAAIVAVFSVDSYRYAYRCKFGPNFSLRNYNFIKRT